MKIVDITKNYELIKETYILSMKEWGHKRIYLKSDLKNYYEKFGAIKFDKLNNGEDLFYMDL